MAFRWDVWLGALVIGIGPRVLVYLPEQQRQMLKRATYELDIVVIQKVGGEHG